MQDGIWDFIELRSISRCRVRGASTPPAEVKLPHRSRYMNLHTLQWTSPSPPIAGGPSPAESHLEFHT